MARHVAPVPHRVAHGKCFAGKAGNETENPVVHAAANGDRCGKATAFGRFDKGCDKKLAHGKGWMHVFRNESLRDTDPAGIGRKGRGARKAGREQVRPGVRIRHGVFDVYPRADSTAEGENQRGGSTADEVSDWGKTALANTMRFGECTRFTFEEG